MPRKYAFTRPSQNEEINYVWPCGFFLYISLSNAAPNVHLLDDTAARIFIHASQLFRLHRKPYLTADSYITCPWKIALLKVNAAFFLLAICCRFKLKTWTILIPSVPFNTVPARLINYEFNFLIFSFSFCTLFFSFWMILFSNWQFILPSLCYHPFKNENYTNW